MTFSLISCVDENFGIGYKNKLLTHLPNDLKRFKQLTKGKFCIMGRKTYESIIEMNGEPLKDRGTIILTKDVSYRPPKANKFVEVYNDVNKLIQRLTLINNLSKNTHSIEFEYMVCGGSEIYNLLLPYTDKIYLTIIHNKFEHVDTFFPRFSLNEWKIVSSEFNFADEEHLYNYSFVTYLRKRGDKQ